MSETPRIPRWLRLAPLAAVAIALSACASNAPLDTLEPEGPAARDIDDLFNLVFYVATIVFFLVMGAIAWVSIRNRAKPRPDGSYEEDLPDQSHGNKRLEIGLTMLSALVLVVLAVPTMQVLFDLFDRTDNAEVEIEVYGHQWWWEFRYPDAGVTTANTIVFPAGQDIKLTMTSRDVIHSFWLPTLNGKRDVAPGRIHTWNISSDEPGVFWGNCAEYCGLSHANMRIRAVALSPEEYEAWLAEQSVAQPEVGEGVTLAVDRPSEVNRVGDPNNGYTLFGQWCSSCHVVQGQYTAAADGNAALLTGYAPDLTHLMSRTGIASNLYDLYNEDGSVNLAELRTWVWDAPSIKPMAADELRGMPSFAEQLSRDQVDDILAYLMTLGDRPTLPGGDEDTFLEEALRRD